MYHPPDPGQGNLDRLSASERQGGEGRAGTEESSTVGVHISTWCWAGIGQVFPVCGC